MNTLQEIETAIRKVNPLEYDALLNWLSDQMPAPDRTIDVQLKADLEAGYLDERIRRAKADYECSRTAFVN